MGGRAEERREIGGKMRRKRGAARATIMPDGTLFRCKNRHEKWLPLLLVVSKTIS